MTFQTDGERYQVPTPSDAARMLREISPVASVARRAARDVAFAYPLLAWGLAWTAGTALFWYVSGPVGVAAGYVVCAAAVGVCWMVRPRDVRLLPERRFALLWFAFLAASPFLVAVAQPGSTRLTMLFLASLWGVGMLLYGIAMKDPQLAVTGAVILVAAAIARVAAPDAATLIVGFGGGTAMGLLGAWRLRWAR